MEETDKHWLAGFLEGEGSFCSPPPSSPKSPYITVQTTDKDVAERVAELFRVAYSTSDRGKDKGWKRIYGVVLKGPRAVEIMMELVPLMGRRRQIQINKAIEGYIFKPKLIDADLDEISKARELGESYRSLGRRYGVNHETVRKFLSQHRFDSP